jgi:hypothetical protein
MDEMTLLREFRDSAPATAPAAVRRRVLAEPPHGRAGTRWQRPALASAVAVAAVTAAVLALGAGPAAPPSAATVLERAATHVLESPASPAPRPDQWIYTRSLDADPVTGEAGSRPGESWARVDGQRTADVLPNGRVHVQPVVANPLGTPMQWYDLLRDLPDSPQGVLDALADDPLYTSHGTTGADRAFDEVATALTADTVIAPESVARLYRALASIPGVSVDEDARPDLVGRSVLSITYTGRSSLGRPGDRWELLIDPRSYRVIGLRGTAGTDLDLKDGTVIPTGSVWFNTAYLDERLVDEPGER